MSITQGQAAARILYALVPLATLIAWNTQSTWDATFIACAEEILVKSENKLKESKAESVCISKDLNKCFKEKICFQQEIICLNKDLTDTHDVS